MNKKWKLNFDIRCWVLWAAVCCSLTLPAQDTAKNPFISPFEFPLFLSGNFGELRSNHFHGGLDFKTQGVVGKPIRCIADGYISRVTVTPGGYGQAVYITHDNGYTSVYGHLVRFMAEVSRVVEAYQYEHETFPVDLTFEPERFPLKQGEVFAWAGNEGYSFGPHLHMEIRKTDTGEYIDPMQFYLNRIKDTTPPRASQIVFYPQPGTGVVEGVGQKKKVDVGNLHVPITAWGKIALGIQAYDYMDGTNNNYGVYSVQLFVDSVEVFSSRMDGFFSNENRLVNAWADYEEHILHNKWIMRSHVLPGNAWRMLHSDEERGVISIEEERDYSCRYVLEDLHGNRKVYQFVIRGQKQPIVPKRTDGRFQLRWDQANVITQPGMELVIPKGMLYEDVDLNCKVVTDSLHVSFDYQLHDKPVPLHGRCSLMIGVRRYPLPDMSKYYVVRKFKGKKISAGGYFKEGFMHAQIRELGTYSVALDTVAPRIVPLNQSQWKNGNIQFKIQDAETGIKDYKVYVDGRFMVFKFSSKNAKLTCLHPKRIKKGVPHQVEVLITDYCGNEARETYKF